MEILVDDVIVSIMYKIDGMLSLRAFAMAAKWLYNVYIAQIRQIKTAKRTRTKEFRGFSFSSSPSRQFKLVMHYVQAVCRNIDIEPENSMQAMALIKCDICNTYDTDQKMYESGIFKFQLEGVGDDKIDNVIITCMQACQYCIPTITSTDTTYHISYLVDGAAIPPYGDAPDKLVDNLVFITSQGPVRDSYMVTV